MGTTNLQHALNNKSSHLKGERDATRTRISRIEEMIVAIPQMQVEVEQLDSLIDTRGEKSRPIRQSPYSSDCDEPRLAAIITSPDPTSQATQGKCRGERITAACPMASSS